MKDNQTDDEKNIKDFKIGDADSYNTVVDYFDAYTERFTSHMPEPIIKLAEIPKNGLVLDVGTGTGIIALNVAKVISDNAKIIGIDLSDGMLSAAKSRAQEKGVASKTEFRKMDAEQLAFENNIFDSALSLYALRHFPNPERAIQEIYRVLKPGARIVVAVGSSPSLFSVAGVKAGFRRLASILRQASGRELVACGYIDELVNKYIPEESNQEIAGWVGKQHHFSGSVKQLIQNAGFVGVKTSWEGQYSIIDSPEDFWLLQMTFSSVARKRIGSADKATVDKLKSEFIINCEKVLNNKGRLVYQTGASIVCGIKPKH